MLVEVSSQFKIRARYRRSFSLLYKSYTGHFKQFQVYCHLSFRWKRYCSYWRQCSSSRLRSIFGFDPVFIGIQVEGAVLALASLDACIVSVIVLVLEKESRGGRGQRDYTTALAKVLSMAKHQLISSLHQFAQYWHSKKLEVSTVKKSMEAR